MMNPQSIGLGIANWLTRLLLFLTIITTAVVITFGTPLTLEREIRDAQAYQRFVPAVIESTTQNKQPTSYPLADKNIQAIFINSFPPRDLQAKTETVINSTYAWLNGQAPQPTFTVDFQPNLDALATGLSDYAINRLAFLPTCVEPPTQLDPFTTTCRPERLDLEVEKQRLHDTIVKENTFLPKSVYTEKDLPKGSDGLTIPEEYPHLPQWFVWAKQAPWILGAGTLLSAVGVVWLSRSKRRAIRSLGMMTVVNAIFLALSPIVFTYLIPRYLPQLIQFSYGGTGAQKVINSVSLAINNRFNYTLLTIVLLAILIGTATLLLERATRNTSPYKKLEKKAGLATSLAKRNYEGKVTLSSSKVPLQSSEVSVTKAPKRVKNKKYRKIPRGELK